MGVAKGVDVENIDKAGRHEYVLDQTGEHVPGIQEEDTGEEVHDIGGAYGHQNVSEGGLFQEREEGAVCVMPLFHHRRNTNVGDPSCTEEELFKITGRQSSQMLMWDFYCHLHSP